MQSDLDAPAEVKWHVDEAEPPEDWSDATPFPSLRAALDAIVNGMPQTGHPWVRSAGRLYAPLEVEDLWREGQKM